MGIRANHRRAFRHPALRHAATGEAVGLRVIVFMLEAWDVNCHQHILPRYSEAEITPAVNKLVARIQELEAEVARLKGGGLG